MTNDRITSHNIFKLLIHNTEGKWCFNIPKFGLTPDHFLLTECLTMVNVKNKQCTGGFHWSGGIGAGSVLGHLVFNM